MILLSSALGSFIQLLGVLIIFLFVLAITYFTTKWIGNYQKTNFANKNLQIVESIRVGNNKFIAIVKAGEVYLVVAVGKDDVTLLTQLTEEQLSEVPDLSAAQNRFPMDGKAAQENFREVLNRVKEHFPKKYVLIMTRVKKTYCMVSLIVAMVVLVLTLSWSAGGTTVYAASMDPDSITTFDGDNSEGGVTRAAEDSTNGLTISYNNDGGSLSAPVKMLLVLTILSLAPSILIMLTSYTRIIIVLHFLRTAIGTQTAPPNQVLIALALFLTFFIMWPTFQQINTEAIQPLDKGEITTEEAFTVAQGPIREFMYGQTQEKDLKLFVDISDETYDSYDDVPMTTLIPAFILSELRAAFIIGFVIYIPFIVIDMVVASVLMSMGMMMLPPTTISLPFKILLFILADGWDLVIGSLVKTFY